MIEVGRITDESMQSKLTIDEFGLFREKPKTNEDQIRTMDSEHLASFILDVSIIEPWCDDPYPVGEECEKCINGDVGYVKDNNGHYMKDCAKCVLEWLKQPSEK